jgi:outer membrane lipoprotein-sorting protein
MRLGCPLPRATALTLPFLLSGCSYFIPTKRHLPVPKTPEAVQTVSPDDLVKQVNARWDAMNTLTATVEVYATELKSAEGFAKDFPSCRGYILMRKPKMLRVAGTYFGVKIFDMASDGSRFTLLIPSRSTVIEGSNTVTQKSANPLENLRPDFFLDAIAVRGLDADNEYMVTSDTETVTDAQNKHLYSEPEYTLDIMRRKQGQENLPVRTVTFHRDDMLPHEQSVYDQNGALETQITYSDYQVFSAGKYPSKVTIKRPQEGIQLVLSVYRVEENVDLPANQFEVKIPEDVKIQTLK